MQQGKISKILDGIVARSTFARLRSKERHSYKDHLFLEILSAEGSLARQLLSSKMQDWQIFQLKLRIKQLIASNPIVETQQIDEFHRNFLRNLVETFSPDEVTTLHAVVAIAEDQSTALHSTLTMYGILASDLRKELVGYSITQHLSSDRVLPIEFKIIDSQQTKHREERQEPKHPLDKFGVELTKLARNGEIDPVIGREREIERIIEILSRRKKNNPILIGEAGVGKSAVVEGLALRIASGDVPYNISKKRLFSLDISSLVAGTKFRGEFEERMQQLLEALKESRDTIIFIDEIHTIVGAGATQGSLDTANILKPALARGELQVVGATTLDEYRKDIESDSALERRFQRIIVEPTSEEATLEILRNVAPHYEEHHRVRYSDEALAACVSLSGRYITDRHFPDKAIDILDEAGARAHLRVATPPTEIKELERSLAETSAERGVAINSLAYTRASEIRNDEIALTSHLNERLSEWHRTMELSPVTIEVEDIEAVITSVAGVPAERVTSKESERLLGLGEHLRNQVIGQQEAVEKLSRAIYRSRAGLKDHHRPIGVFMFVGPTGVGKTLLAKEISKWLFDERRGLIRIDMSEYGEKHNVSRLIGSPPGYVGYGEGGQLSEAVRRQPYAVVLLDEIEKAHPEVFNSMLQIFDEGHLTDGSGRKVDFSNTIIIMTSNVGSRVVAKRRKQVGYSTTVKCEQTAKSPTVEYRKSLERTFAPEFLNRIDDVVVFHSLSLTDVKQIVELEIAAIRGRVEALGYSLRITDCALQTLSEIGYSAEYGARSLRRTLSEKVEDPLSELIIAGEVMMGDTIVVEKLKSAKDVKLKIA